MTHLSFLVTSLSHLSPVFTHDLWPRKMERRKLCSVGHLEDPVWNWNEHKSLSLLSLQKRPSDSFSPPVPQKKIKAAPVFDLNVWLTGGPFYTLGKTKPFPSEDLSKHENSPHSHSLSQCTTRPPHHSLNNNFRLNGIDGTFSLVFNTSAIVVFFVLFFFVCLFFIEGISI